MGTIRVTGWHAENIAREFSETILYSADGKVLTVEEAGMLMQNVRSRSDADDRVYADVPVEHSLELTLKNHDWYFSYSDDHGAWCSGQAVLAKIGKLMKQSDPVVAEELMNKYCPWKNE